MHASDVGALAAAGVGLMLVGFAEGLGAAKTYAAREHEQLDATASCWVWGGQPGIRGLERDGRGGESVQDRGQRLGGARSQLSGLIVAGLTVVRLLALTGLFEDLPAATLAAIMVAAVIDLIDVPVLVSLYRASSRRPGREFGFVARPDVIAAIAALLGMTVFDPLPGLFIGIAVSLLLLIYRASRPYVATLGRTPGPDGHHRDVDRHPDAEAPDHMAVLRVESSLYFANADTVRTRILQAAGPEPIQAVVLDAETIPFIDVTSARMLAELTDELHERGFDCSSPARSGRSATSYDMLSTTACSPTSTPRFRPRWTPPATRRAERAVTQSHSGALGPGWRRGQSWPIRDRATRVAGDRAV